MSKTSKLLFIAMILQMVWGLVPSASKFVIDDIPVELYIALRWTISGIVFGLYVLFRKRWRPVPLKSCVAVAMLGILGYGVASFCTLSGLRIGGVTHFALMSTLSPAVTSLIAILILGERPTRMFLLALPLSITGLLLLVLGKYRVSSFEIAGMSSVWVVGGYVLEAFVFVFSKKFRSQMSATQYLVIAQLSASSVAWLAQMFFFHQTQELAHLTSRGWIAALYVSIVACVLCYATLHWLLSYIEGHKLALFDGFHAISATLAGWFFFDETLTPLMICGGFLILCGLAAGALPHGETGSE